MEKAKRTEPELIAFLSRVPKGGDLHNHVGGAVYSDYALNAAIAKGLTFDPATGVFGSDPTKIPAVKLLTDNALLYQFLNAASMRGWSGEGQTGHDHFFASFDFARSARRAMSYSDVLTEVVGRAKAQNLQYMELMAGTTPGEALDAYFKDLPKSDDMPKALEALRPRLEKVLAATGPYLDGNESVGKRIGQKTLTGAEEPITLRYVWSCGRLDDPDTFFAEAAAGIYLAAKEPRVAAMNIVAPEDHPLSRTQFDWQMQAIDFLWKELGKPNLTLHAGELTLALSPPEPMRDRIRKTIEVGHARRIGHGVSIAYEDDVQGLLAKMRREGIAVEICLSSNASILGVSGDRHPLRLYRSAGVPVFLNTDDEGVSRSTMTIEWVRAVREQGMTYRDLKEMARNSIEYSFLPGQSLFTKRNYGKPLPAFRDCGKPDWQPSPEANRLLAGSEKMRVQLRLERAFATFEKDF